MTHEILDALFMASRFMFLKEGIILFDGDRDAFLHSQVSQVNRFMKLYENIVKAL